MDLNLKDYNVRDATLRSLLGVAHALGATKPEPSQQEEFAEIADQLEARIQDELEKISGPEKETVEKEPFQEVPKNSENDPDVFLVWVNEEVSQVVVNGAIFGKFCNALVWSDPDNPDHNTLCIKQWGHANMMHEDAEGHDR